MLRHIVLTSAAIGLALSLLLHLATFTDYDFRGEVDTLLDVLGFGLAVVWIANIPAWNRLGEGLSTLDRRTLQFVPVGVRSVWFVCFAYMLFTALTQAKYHFVLQNTSPVPTRQLQGAVLKVFTAAFICFYLLVVAVRYTAVKRDNGGDGVV